MRRWILGALVALAACIPYRETWRPELHGILVDAQGIPLRNVEVHACSKSRWWSFEHGCEVEDVRQTDDTGAFAFDVAKRWEWISCVCPGEAPGPETLVFVCTPGGVASAFARESEFALKVAVDGGSSDPQVARFLAHRCP